jgi:hypothetical protein
MGEPKSLPPIGTLLGFSGSFDDGAKTYFFNKLWVHTLEGSLERVFIHDVAFATIEELNATPKESVLPLPHS